MTLQQDIKPQNGVDLAALLEARQALETAPDAAHFTWRAKADWVDGTHSRTTLADFFGLGEEQARTMSHVVSADHPELFAAGDNGATPVEIVLAGLASCLTAGVATVAANRGIALRSVSATIEADMDLAGILGIDAEVRNGFSDVRVNFTIDADASEEDLEALVSQSQKRSAVYDVLTNPTAVEVRVTSSGAPHSS